MNGSNFEKWDMDGDRVKFDTLLECGVTAVSPFQVVMRLDYATKAHLEDVRKGRRQPRKLQLGVNPDAALKIAELLVQYARSAQAAAAPAKKEG
ncbi:MAG: hypothetical protein ABTQ31_11300 [Rhizobiaceae bacterium]